MTVAIAHPVHLDHLAQLRAALWRDADPAALRAEAEKLLHRHDCAALLAMKDAVIVGFIEVSLRSHVEGCDTSPAGYVEGWYVLPEQRGRGIGRRLLEKAQDWCRGRGCTHIGSDTEVTNHASRAAHRALGFDELPPIVCFYKSIDGDNGPS